MRGSNGWSSKRDQHSLDGTRRVLQAWTTRDLGATETQAAALRQAIPTGDGDRLERHGGLNVALEDINQFAQENPVLNGRGMINDFRPWGARRCRRMGEYSTETRLFTWIVHTSDNQNAFLSEGGGTRRCGWRRSRNATSEAGQHGFPASDATMDSEAAPRLWPPRPARRRAAREGVLVVGATLYHFLAADAPRGGGRLFMPLFILVPCLLGVAPTTVIPGGKASARQSLAAGPAFV